MWRAVRSVFLGLLASMLAILPAGCATSNVLQVKGGLTRPAARGPGQGSAGRAVAIADFAHAGKAGGDVGRDFDRARPITWSGSPGKAIPDLVAAVLIEKGVPVVRVADEANAPADAAAKVWGRIDAFRVDAKRTGTFKIEDAAHVAVTVYGTGGAPPQWSTAVASDYWSADALFVTEAGALDALAGAANAVAEEVVKRLVSAGVIPAPAAAGSGDTERK